MDNRRLPAEKQTKPFYYQNMKFEELASENIFDRCFSDEIYRFIMTLITGIHQQKNIPNHFITIMLSLRNLQGKNIFGTTFGDKQNKPLLGRPSDFNRT